MNTHLRAIFRTTLLTVVLVSTGAIAAPESTPDLVPDSAEGLGNGAKPGWHPLLKLAAHFALGHNQNVPGNPEGLTFNFGYFIEGDLGYLSETKEHEWVNNLDWQLGYARTPSVDALIKSVDNIDFRTTYLYHIPKLPWLGPFLRFRLTSPMLPGYDIRADATNVLRLEPNEKPELDAATGNPIDPADGSIIDSTHPRVEVIDGGKPIELTEAFAPLTLRESVGFFALPVTKTEFKLDIRLGFGAWETFARDFYYIDDNGDSKDILELRRMQDPIQMGPELGVAISGEVKKIMRYSAEMLLMQPVYHNVDSDLKGIELFNAEFEVNISFNLWKYLTIDYVFKAYKQPLVIDKWQIQNSLMVSLAFTLIGGEAPPPPTCICPKVEPCPAAAPPQEEVPTPAPTEGSDTATNPVDETP